MDEIKSNEIENVFNNITEDDSLEDVIRNATATSTVEEKEEVTEEVKEEPKKLTPLQEFKLRKEKEESGIIYSNEELKKGEESAPSKDIVHNDDRSDEWDKRELEFELDYKRRAAVVQIKQYNDQREYMNMIQELEDVEFTLDGPRFKHPDSIQFFRLRTENDPPYTAEDVKNGVPAPEAIENQRKLDESNNSQNAEITSGDEDEEENKTENTEDKSKDNSIQIIIDKTGLGTDFAFTEEERTKIQQAETIEINEIKTIDINAIKSKRSSKSFQDIVKEHDIRGSRVKICFPASGFKADMKGLTYGEYADVALAMDSITTDQYYKRLSVIYNKMTNISCGEFSSFDDFLHKFSYTDIPLALYAMYVATEPEVTDVQLRCTRANCGKNYSWKYSTRSLLRLDRSSETIRTKMKEIITAAAIDYDNIADESDVRNSKYIKLPESGFIVEIGVASSYEFIYNFVPLMDENAFREQFGNNSQAYLDNVILLTIVRSVRIPDPDDPETYIVCDNYKDILDAIYNISPEEIKILTAYTLDIQDKYDIVFSLGKVVCPHCGAVTDNLDVSMDEMVFRTYSRLMNTRVKLKITQNS